MGQIHTVKFFLASSDELAFERDRVELIVSRKNAVTIDQQLFLEVVRWEQLAQTAGGTRIQNYFNGQVSNCDAMIALFHSKVGPYTEEELSFALERHKRGDNPKYMYLYFKDAPIAISELSDSVTDIPMLKAKLRADEVMYHVFESADALEVHLSKQLDLLIAELRKIYRPIVVSRDKVFSEASQIPTDSNSTNRVLTGPETRDLAEKLGLLQQWSANPHLTQDAGDIAFYAEQEISAGRLEAQFRAKVLLLEEADRIGFKYSEPGDVSEHAKEIESRILDVWYSRRGGSAST